MEELIHLYWKEVIAIVSGIIFIIRLEMVAKGNATRIKALEKKLSQEKMNDFIEFRTETRMTLSECQKDIAKLQDRRAT